MPGHLIICRGLPASGKSTWAKAEVAKLAPKPAIVVNRDTLRLQNPGRGEGFIRTLRDDLIEEHLMLGYIVISDDTNLIHSTFNGLVELAKRCVASFQVKDFTDVSVEECIKRDAARPASVGAAVIRRFAKLVGAAKRQPVNTQVAGLPTAILCDLDGTLALFNGRGPFETGKCETDILSIPVNATMQGVRNAYLQNNDELHIILMSGREDKFRPHTERWLVKNNVYYDQLYMRTTADKRKDAIVKRELFDAHIKDKYNVLFVLDDRDQVVRMWRHDLNLVVFQVSEGNF